LYALTTYGVDCSEFKSYFGDDLKSITVNDKSSLQELARSIDRVLSNDNKAEHSADTRVKIDFLVSSGDSVESVCIGSTSLSYKNGNYIIDDDFRDFLE